MDSSQAALGVGAVAALAVIVAKKPIWVAVLAFAAGTLATKKTLDSVA